MPSHARHAFGIALVVTLGGFVFGYDAAVISGTIPFIARIFDLSEMQVGVVVSAPGFGVLFALLLAGYLCDRFGRKPALIAVAALYLVSAVWSAAAQSYPALVLARFLGGLAFASLSLTSMYLGEIAPSRWRGRLVAMNQTSIVLGFSAAYFINYGILRAASYGVAWAEAGEVSGLAAWRWMLGAEIPFALLWLFGLGFVPESPRWLFRRGRTEQARAVMARVLPPDEVETEVREVESSLREERAVLGVIGQLRKLGTRRFRRVLWLGLTIAAVQQVTGINAVLFYAPTVFEQLGGGTDAAFRQSVVVGVISVVFTLLAVVTIDRWGRRHMLVGGLAWCLASLALCGYGFSTARYVLSEDALTRMPADVDPAKLRPLVGREFSSDAAYKDALKAALGERVVRDEAGALLQQGARLDATLILLGVLSFIAAFQFSVGPIMWVLFSEIFPTAVRGAAIPAFAFITSTVSYLVTLFFPWQLSTLGAAATFFSYALLVAIGLVLVCRWLPETKNRTLEEIEEMFANAAGKGRSGASLP